MGGFRWPIESHPFLACRQGKEERVVFAMGGRLALAALRRRRRLGRDDGEGASRADFASHGIGQTGGQNHGT